MNNRILIVEDMPEYQKLIQISLGYKYQLDITGTLQEARVKLLAHEYQMIILDVLLPDGSGYDLCRELQSNPNCQDLLIVFLTAKDSISDKVMGFSTGIDDYIVKPFDPSELVARVDLRILKSEKRKKNIENFKKGPLRFEMSGLRLFIANNEFEENINLTPIEFKILLKLAKNSNQIFSRQQILDSIWGQGVFIDDRSIDKHISTIRKKIEPFHDYIKTISGIGYEFKF